MTRAKKPYQMAVMHPLPRVNEIRYEALMYMYDIFLSMYVTFYHCSFCQLIMR